MARNFDPNSIVVLPRLTASEGLALATALRAAAKGKKGLPGLVSAALDKVASTGAALEKSLEGRSIAAPEESTRARAADAKEDAAFRALEHWLLGWSELDLAEGKQAKKIHDALFGDGLAFTQMKFKAEWGEAEARLQVLKKDHAKAIDALGGTPFVQNLDKAHKEYGDALGLTSTKAPPPPPTGVREKLDAFAGAVRSYALKVAAHADEPKFQEAAGELLAPLTHWISSAPKASLGVPIAPIPASPGA